MEQNLCLLCNRPELKAKPRADKDFVCSRCVQYLLKATQEAIQEALVECIKTGNERNATALQMFKEDEKPKQRNQKRKITRRLNGGRKRFERQAIRTLDGLRKAWLRKMGAG